MFTFILQLIDLAKLNQVGLFLIFFIMSWSIYVVKLIMMRRDPLHKIFQSRGSKFSVSVIVPVVDEPEDVWIRTMTGLKDALRTFNHHSQVIVVANGNNGHKNLKIARDMGFEVIKLGVASKRLAIKAGVEMAMGDITLIVDSDTFVMPDSISKLVRVFADPTVGGATPKHIVGGRDENLMRRVSDWLEDIRFEEVVRGQSSTGAVSCLPGRLLAIRTNLLKEIIPDLVGQTFLGRACISGDDRFLTSELLRKGHKTIFVPDSIVVTEAPDNLGKFILQRLRWSRTSMRETLRSLSWTFDHGYMSFTVLSTVIMRWFFFVVIVTGVMSWLEIIHRAHAVDLPTWLVVVGTIMGFMVSGIVRQLRHLLKYPQDLKYFPAFLLITTFILTPVEWWGNVSLRESHWMTRKVS